MGDGADEVQWPGRLRQATVRQLYLNDARGLIDDDLIEEAGLTIYLRVQAILQIKAAVDGRVQCPRCAKAGRTHIILRPTPDPATRMTCENCGWTCTWGDYRRTFQRKQLNSGGAVPGFEAFVQAWEEARTPRAKWLAIDRLIHVFHYSLRDRPELPTRPACVNFIEGNLKNVVQFLTELSAGTLTPEVTQTSEAWREEYRKIPWGAAWRKSETGKMAISAGAEDEPCGG